MGSQVLFDEIKPIGSNGRSTPISAASPFFLADKLDNNTIYNYIWKEYVVPVCEAKKDIGLNLLIVLLDKRTRSSLMTFKDEFYYYATDKPQYKYLFADAGDLFDPLRVALKKDVVLSLTITNSTSIENGDCMVNLSGIDRVIFVTQSDMPFVSPTSRLYTQVIAEAKRLCITTTLIVSK